MKALLLVDKKRFEFTQLPVPEIGPEDLLVRVKACGICGSDVHGYDGSSGRRIPPIVMGHEAAGTVAAVGANVKGHAVGDRVTFDSTVFCGTCIFCQRGDVNLCDNRQVIGVSCGDYRRHGAFAEFVAVPQRILYPLPKTISFAEAAMLEAVSVALHAVRVPTVEEKALPYDRAAPGMIGLELALAVSITLGGMGGDWIPTLVDRLTIGPYRVLGKASGIREPRLRIGEAATCVLFDPASEWTVEPAHLRSGSQNTPLLGARLRGRVLMTLVDGALVHHDRQRLPWPVPATATESIRA